MTFAANAQAQSDAWVDLLYPGTELGTEVFPFDTLGEALSGVSSGGTVHLGPGDSHETIVISQPVQLEAAGGTARIGVLSSPLGSGAPLEWLRITEIMYNPGDGGAEFLELQNTGPSAVEVSGVYFSAGITFAFPASTTLSAGEIVVLVRDSDQSTFFGLYGVNGDGVYTGALDNGGETISMSTSGGIQFLSLTYDDGGGWPNQADGQGRSLVILDPQGNGSDPANWALSEFDGGSPGGSEVSPSSPVADTEFSVDRGFYSAPFNLELSTNTLDATIRYTLDGSTPTCGTGTVYSGPISISGTSIVRAIACKTGWLPTNVDTQTYLFINDIITQPANPGGGWPNSGQIVNNQIFDFGMDPNVVNNVLYTDLMDDALLSIPSISLVTDLDNLVHPTTGLYVNAIAQVPPLENPVSIELINPDGSLVDPNGVDGFQIDAGLRIRGGSSRGGWNPKHAFRLFFRDEYGAGKLEYPLFGDEGANEFDKIDLRTSQQYSWHQGGSTLATFNRDVFSRDTQRDMGQPYTRSRYYHLYLNGVYWGLFQSQERAEARFAASYFGGVKEDYDVVKVDSGLVAENPWNHPTAPWAPIWAPFVVEATDGTLTVWNQLWNEANLGLEGDVDYYFVQGLNADASPNPAYDKILDVDNLIDYMLVIFYGGNLDAPITNFGSNNVPNNFYTTYNRLIPDGFKSYAHDSEHTLLLGNVVGQGDELFRDRTGPFPAGNNIWHSNPQWIHQKLVAHPEYRMRFADRAHRHLFNDGALTPAPTGARFNSRADEIDLAVIGESARWGDYGSPVRTRNLHWVPAVNNILSTYFPQRTDIVLDQLRSKGWYPSVDAPVFYMNSLYQHGGYAASPYSMSMTNASGTVYYTLDGSDPRLPGTSDPGAGTLIVSQSASKKVLVPTGAGDLDQSGTPWTDLGFNDASWTSGTGGVGYENSSGYEAHFSIDVGAEMYNGNTTACIRIPFTLTSQQVADAANLTLRVKYDDGFMAYLNGTEVASANAPGSPAWNSAATAAHGDAAAVVLQGFNIDAYAGELLVGANVLAIQGLNVSTTSSDFLISAELEAFTCSSVPLAAAPSAITYAGPFVLTENTHVKARAFNCGVWSALNEATFVTSDFTGDLRITEIMYNPLNPLAEFIELKNIGTSPINMVNTAFTEGIHFTFPDMVLAPEAFALVVKDTAAFTSVYGGGYPIAGEYTGSLDNGGERIRLEDPTGTAIHDFRYKDGWYDITDGGGYSLTIRYPTSGWLAGWNDKDGWRASALVGGSPGALDWIYVPGIIVINEVLAHSHDVAPDWIELHNTAGVTVNIGGWFLSDTDLDLMRYKIASGTTIPAGGYIVFYQDVHFGNAGDPGANSPFGLSENGETVYLSSGSGAQVTGYRDKEDFGASERDVAFGRYLKSDGTFNFVSMSSKTPDAANAYPLVGPVVINEIMYHPATVNKEYVELRNTTGSTVNLYDAESNPWIFSDGIAFTFPPATTIPANGFLLVAKDPVAFADEYSPPGGVVVLGPYIGELSNGGEKLELAKPGDVDGSSVRQYVRVDRVNYDDVAPWPTGPDGGGTALKRIVTTNYGNDVANWQAAAPTPGL